MSNSLKFWKIPLSKLFFYALILFLPFNINRAYFTETSFFYRYHIFYHTIFIYLTDVIIYGLVLNWFIVSVKQTSLADDGEARWAGFKQLVHKIFTNVSPARLRLDEVQSGKQKPIYQILALFWLILAISISVSQKSLLNAYGFVKISEFLLVFLYVKQNLHFTEMRTIQWLIVIGAIIQSGIGILQFLYQHSLGIQGLGESLLIPGMTGIAEFYSGGDAVIRAYGTFPHPNLLGAFLFVGLLASISLIYAKNRLSAQATLEPSPGAGEGGPVLRLGEGLAKLKRAFREIFLALSLILISTGLTLTFSRTVWAAAVIVLTALFIASRFYKKRVFYRMQSGQRAPGHENYHPARILAITLLLAAAFCFNWFLFGNQIKDRLNVSREIPFAEQESIVDRRHFVSVSHEMIKDNPIFGVGLRNFVARMDEYNLGDRLLPHQHQPVHNIYLLLWAETGILGLAAFLWLIFQILKQGIRKLSVTSCLLLVSFLGFLFLGFFDHYFFSLHQGGLMFWLVAGMVALE